MNRERQQAARRHSKARASARLRLVLNRDDLAQVVADIQGGRSTHLWTQSLTRAWHLVAVKGQQVVAIYGKHIKAVHTFYTVEMAREALSKFGAVDALNRLEVGRDH